MRCLQESKLTENRKISCLDWRWSHPLRFAEGAKKLEILRMPAASLALAARLASSATSLARFLAISLESSRWCFISCPAAAGRPWLLCAGA